MVSRISFFPLSSLLYAEWDERPTAGMCQHNAGMCQHGNAGEIVQMVERQSRNGEVSGSNPGSITFSHCRFKNYSAY